MPASALPAVTTQVRYDEQVHSGAGEWAFAYAKACGIIGKSFLGERSSALEKLGSLQELDRLVFPNASREMIVRELLADIEGRILDRTVQHIRSVINSFSVPPELLVLQLRSCEYADLKSCLYHLATRKAAPPVFNNLGRFRTVRFALYPHLSRMLVGTEFAFILEKYPKAIMPADITAIEIALDRQYYTLLVKSIGCLSSADSINAKLIISEEICLRNCIWALRLRSYFNKSEDETAECLMGLSMPNERSLAAQARKSLRFPLDSRQSWNGWRWEQFLNPQNAGQHWTVDPRYFQNAASRYLYRLSRRYFRAMPLSLSSIFCFIKLKQYEENILISVAEGLGLGMTGKDVFAMLEASP